LARPDPQTPPVRKVNPLGRAADRDFGPAVVPAFDDVLATADVNANVLAAAFADDRATAPAADDGHLPVGKGGTRMVEGGTVTLRNGLTQPFYDRTLLDPYLAGFEKRKRELGV
jgi:hypothetical protein